VLPHFGFPLLEAHARERRLRPWVRTAHELVRRFPVSRRELATTFGIRPALRGALSRNERDASNEIARSILAADLAAELRPELREAAREAEEKALSGERAMHLDTISQPLYQQTLEIADKAAHAFGIEPRYPFFDRRLIEFCVGLPDEQKFAGGWPRYLFRRAMQGVLPPEVQWRPTKGNLAPNFDRRLRAIDGTMIRATCERASGMRPYVDPVALQVLGRRYFASANWGGPEGAALFRAAMLSQWLPTLDGPRDEIPEAARPLSTQRAAAPLDAERAVCLRT